MVHKLALLAFGGLAIAAPAPVPEPATEIPAVFTTPPRGTEPGAAPTRVSDHVTGPTTHGPYSGTATTTGAVKAPTTITDKIDIPLAGPTHTYYNPNGLLSSPAPLPYMPGGKSLKLQYLGILY